MARNWPEWPGMSQDGQECARIARNEPEWLDSSRVFDPVLWPPPPRAKQKKNKEKSNKEFAAFVAGVILRKYWPGIQLMAKNGPE